MRGLKGWGRGEEMRLVMQRVLRKKAGQHVHEVRETKVIPRGMIDS